MEARLKGLHDALARSALAPLSPAELEVQDRARILARDFGYPASFDFQLRAVSAVCTGHNTCLVWPAGAGKGLCTQLVAGCFPGMVTLCLVPLLALGHELCRNLNLAFGTPNGVRLQDGTVRPVGFMLGGGHEDDYYERIGQPPADVADRRRATLAGDTESELCADLDPSGVLGILLTQLQMQTYDGRRRRPVLGAVSTSVLGAILLPY